MLKRAHRNRMTLCAAIVLLAACSKPAPEPAAQSVPASGVDYHSFANTNDYRTTHIELDITVDFERKVLVSQARLQLERRTRTTTPWSSTPATLRSTPCAPGTTMCLRMYASPWARTRTISVRH